MRYQCLILEAGANAITVPLHHRLTVIAGVGRLERESLIGELLGALAGGRGGAHLEIVDDQGRSLSVHRPADGGPAEITEIETGRNVTSEFAGPEGQVDLLRHYGLTLAEARQRLRVTSTDVTAATRSDVLVNALASVDQQRLWGAAERVRTTDAQLKAAAEGMGASAEDAPIIEEIEKRHEAFESAQKSHENVRHHGIFIGGACAIGAVPAALLNRFAAFPFLLVAIITTLVSIVFRRRMEQAHKAEQEALAAAGARSYIGFHLQRVNGLMQGQHDRHQVAQAAEEHRKAVDAWRALAGDVAVEWAFAMQDKVQVAAHRLQQGQAAGHDRPGTGFAGLDPADLAHALVARLADLRHAGANGESLPVILDEPLLGAEPSLKQWMLELVGRSAGSPQVVYLTEDTDVASWARMEAVAGHLEVIEPSPDPEGAGAEQLVG